jgi:Acetyltransferase (GNAT) domain
MIQIHFITKQDMAEDVLPRCVELIRRNSGTLPINYIIAALTWWANFNTNENENFGKKRGRNYLGARSWLSHLYFLIAEQGGTIVGVAPLVGYKVMIPGLTDPLRILSFAGDPALISYNDFIVIPDIRSSVLSAMLDGIEDLIKVNFDMLFLGQIPDNSHNLPMIREKARVLSSKGWYSFKTSSAQRAGVWPWTIKPLISSCKVLCEKIDHKDQLFTLLKDLVQKLEICTPRKLFFSATRRSLERQIKDVMSLFQNREDLNDMISNVLFHLSPKLLTHPYIDLPASKDEYLMSLSKNTRRFHRRYARAFGKNKGAYEKITSNNLTERDIEDYLHLHMLRWGEESTAVGDASLNFHRVLCRKSADLSLITLFFASCNGKRIAAHSCFDSGNLREAYYTGRDPEYNDLRAGRLLYLETIYDAIDNGFRLYDLGPGGEQYKYSISNSSALTYNFILDRTKRMTDFNKIFNGFEYMNNSDTYSRIVL